MRKNIVYILGAGFSAPLGIPVMRNFIDRARQIRDSAERYHYFNEIIDLIQASVPASLVFQHNPINIEEVMSLLDMKNTLTSGDAKTKLTRFVIDVIKASTPPNPEFRFQSMPSNTWEALFTASQVWQGYCAFVASLFNLEFREATDHALRGIAARAINAPANYSIVSLNYDMVLENVCEFLGTKYWWDSKPKIHFLQSDQPQPDAKWPLLVKIHGSVDSGDIVIPTFNKELFGEKLPLTWQQAHRALSEANEIRVIGYSLPQTDSYIKYLLMASVDRFRYLNRIDWIVRDSRAEVIKRVNEFIKFENKHLAKADASLYMQSIFGHTVNKPEARGARLITFDRLEQAHEDFMNTGEEKSA